MNRRHLAVIAVIIAVPLFGAPLVSPVPDYGPHLQVSIDNEPVQFETEKEKEQILQNTTTVQYQSLSPAAQRVFDNGYTNSDTGDTHDIEIGSGEEPTVPLDEAPDPWGRFAAANQGVGWDQSFVYVVKNGHYYAANLYRFTPGPSLLAVILRVGPLLGAIGLGTAAGYLVLTADD